MINFYLISASKGGEAQPSYSEPQLSNKFKETYTRRFSEEQECLNVPIPFWRF